MQLNSPKSHECNEIAMFKFLIFFFFFGGRHGLYVGINLHLFQLAIAHSLRRPALSCER